MAARTTAAAGDWNTPGTWTGGVKAGAGDTATLNHVVTVTGDEIVGTSGVAGTLALTDNAGMVFASGGRLRLRGDAVSANVAPVGQGGGRLSFDSSLAASPSTTAYKWTIGTANGQANAYFTATGTAGNRFTVDTVAGCAHGYFDGGVTWTRGGKAKCSYTNFTRIGDATNYSFNYDVNSSSADQFYLDYCTFDDCAGPNNGGGNAIDGTTLRFFHTTFKNSGSALVFKTGSVDTLTSGERSITFCVFDTRPQLYGMTNFTVDDNLFLNDYDVTTAWKSFKRNIVRQTTVVVLGVATQVDCTYIYDNSGQINPHFIQIDGTQVVHDYLGLYFYFNGADEQGDCLLAPSPAAFKRPYRIQRCIAIPNAAGGQTGTLLDCLGDAFVRFEFEHNTYYGGAGGITVGEGIGRVGIIQLYRSNICWGNGSASALKVFDDFSGVVDQLNPLGVSNNLGYLLAEGAAGDGYGLPMSKRPGGTDQNVNPRFVDATRKPETWDATLGGPGTLTNMFAELAKMNDDSGYNTLYTHAALRTYWAGGFLPLEPRARGTAHDGTYIGAVQGPLTARPARVPINQRAA